MRLVNFGFTFAHFCSLSLTLKFKLNGSLKSADPCVGRVLPTEFEVTENFGDFWVALLDIRNLLRCLASVFLRDGGSQIYHGYAWFRAVPALAQSTFR